MITMNVECSIKNVMMEEGVLDVDRNVNILSTGYFFEKVSTSDSVRFYIGGS